MTHSPRTPRTKPRSSRGEADAGIKPGVRTQFPSMIAQSQSPQVPAQIHVVNAVHGRHSPEGAFQCFGSSVGLHVSAPALRTPQ